MKKIGSLFLSILCIITLTISVGATEANHKNISGNPCYDYSCNLPDGFENPQITDFTPIQTSLSQATCSHSWTSWKRVGSVTYTYINLSTCSAAWTESRTCTKCGKEETRNMSSTGPHAWYAYQGGYRCVNCGAHVGSVK